MFNVLKAIFLPQNEPANKRLIEILKRDSSIRVVGRGTVVKDADALIKSRKFRDNIRKLSTLVHQ